MSRRQRLTRPRDLEHVRTEGKRIRIGMLDVRVAASLLAFPRLGTVVGKHGRGSVERNRLKRRVREVFRREVLPGLPPQDLVCRALPTAYDATFAELQAAAREVRRRLVAARPPSS